MKKIIVAGFLVAIMLFIPFHTTAYQIDEFKTPLMSQYACNFQISEDDDPEGQDGPDDIMDYYYFLSGTLLLIVMPFGILHIIKNIGKPSGLIANLIGEFGASAFVVIAMMEAFDYKDVDGDCY